MNNRGWLITSFLVIWIDFCDCCGDTKGKEFEFIKLFGLSSRSHVVILNFHVFLQARTKSMFYCCCPSPKIYSPGMKWIFVNVRIRVSRTTGPAWLRQLDSECLRDSRDVGPGGAQAHKAGPRSWLFFLLDVGGRPRVLRSAAKYWTKEIFCINYLFQYFVIQTELHSQCVGFKVSV